MKQQLHIGLRLLCIISAIGYAVIILTTNKQQNVLSEINTLFDLSIREDQDLRMESPRISIYQGYDNDKKDPFILVDAKTNIDTLGIKKADEIQNRSLNDKNYRADHSYLQYKNPIKVHILDSLFKTKLQKNNISLQIEIQYITNKDTAYSTKKQDFYASASPLEKITTGMNNQIELQVFVKTPFYYRNSNLIATILALIFFLSTAGLVLLFVRKKEKTAIVNKTDTLPLSLELPISVKQITSTLFFDEEKHEIIYNGEHFSIGTPRVLILILMMKDDNYFVYTDTIKTNLWPKQENSTAIMGKNIERLRKDLKPFPELTICYDSKRKGYYLEVAKEEIVNEIDLT